MTSISQHTTSRTVVDEDGYQDEVSSIPIELNNSNNNKQQQEEQIYQNNRNSSFMDGKKNNSRVESKSTILSPSPLEEMSVPYYETENPLKNRIGNIVVSDISPRGHTVMDERSKKMERRRSLQSKIKKPFRDSVNLDLDDLSSLNSSMMSCNFQISTTQPLVNDNGIGQLVAIPKLNLGHIESYNENEDVSSCGLSDCSDIELNSLDTKKTILSNISTETSSTVNTPKPKSTASIIAKAKRPHTARESRRELQYIVANNCSSPIGEDSNGTSMDKKKQIAKLLTSSRSNNSLLQNQSNANTNEEPKSPISQQLKRHSVAREFNSLQDYLATRFKEQKQFLGSNSPTSQKPTNATPRSTALESKLLNMATSLKKTSQVLELNEVKLREERRKSAQAWTLLSIEEDNHSMSQMKYEELRFHYDVKCEELKSAKNKIEQLSVQVKKLEGNYNFLDQEKIRLQREVQELKRTIEKKENERRKRCTIL